MSLQFVSIVILNFNGKTYLRTCLKSVFASDYRDFEVVLVDNGSTDGSLKLVQKHFKNEERLKIVPLDTNYGYAEGNNIGYKYIDSKAKYVVFLNNDTEVSRNWLKEVVEVMEKDNRIGASQPKILRSDFFDEEGFSHASSINVFGEPLKPRFSFKDPYECFYASGSALVTRRDIIDKLGLFNPRFVFYHEDADLCWRIWLSNHKVVCVPSASVFHVGSAIASKTLTPTVINFHYSKNRIYMLLTNYGLKSLVKFVPWTLISYIAIILVNSLLSIARGAHLRPSVLANSKALLYILFNFNHIWKDRMRVQYTIRKVKDDLLIGKLILIPHTPLPEPFLGWLKTLKSYI